MFHIAGYDPRGAGYYRDLYWTEIQKQSKINGLSVRLELLPELDSWRITAGETVTDYTILAWGDIVRQHWAATPGWLYQRAVTAFAALYARGAFGLALRSHRRLFAALVYPFAVLGGVLAVSALAFGLCWPVFGWVLAAAAGLAPWALLPWLENYGYVFWFLRIYHCMAAHGAGRMPALNQRCRDWAARIAADPGASDADEVLILGHSLGVEPAVSVAAALVTEAKERERRPKWSLLTLGQMIPLTARAAAAQTLRDELSTVAGSPDVHWVDVTATFDLLCLPGLDPVAASGATPGHQPRRIPARFHKLFTPEALRRLRRTPIRMHLQYLMASDLPGDYDCFLITAGPLSLADRYPHETAHN